MSAERRNRIYLYIGEKGFASAEELADTLDISAVTVRRDFQRLAKDGLIERVHGGARLLESSTFDTPYSFRHTQAVQAKQLIAEQAVTHLKSGQTLLLDAGTTCAAAAAAIPDHLHLRVVTHSLEALPVLAEKRFVEIISTGGQHNRDLGSFVGPLTEEILSRFHADVSFLAAAHLNVEQGLVNNHLAESTTKRRIHDQAVRCFLLVDHTKFGVPGFQTTLPLEEFRGTVITDAGLDARQRAQFEQRGVALEIAADTTD